MVARYPPQRVACKSEDEADTGAGRAVGSVLPVDDDSTNLPADERFDDGVLDDTDPALDELFDDAAAPADVEFDGTDDDGVPVIAPISDPIATARRRHGAAGAMLAAGMFGADIALGRKQKEEAPVVITASSDPIDIETDGIEIPVDDTTTVFAPPQPPSDPFPPRRPRK